jgi:hypothetical protein
MDGPRMSHYFQNCHQLFVFWLSNEVLVGQLRAKKGGNPAVEPSWMLAGAQNQPVMGA